MNFQQFSSLFLRGRGWRRLCTQIKDTRKFPSPTSVLVPTLYLKTTPKLKPLTSSALSNWHSVITTGNSHKSFSTSAKSLEADSFLCWKCEKEIKTDTEFAHLLCPNCGSPQKLVNGGGSAPNYYKLLGQPETYQVDVEKLATTAKRLQRKLHPDLFAGKAQEEQDLSQELSSFINKAFSTLADPIDRGRYLLQLNGVVDPIGDIEKEITNDPSFLEEVMDLNERLVELSSEQEWRLFREHNEVTLKQLQRELHEAFQSHKIQDAKFILARMKYFDTLQEKLKELKTKLNIVE